MSFFVTSTLSTAESSLGGRRLGQVVSVPNGRLDKVSLFLEPRVTDQAVAEAATVFVDVHEVDGSNLPTGAPIASASDALSAIRLRGMRNFRIEADVPTTVAIVLRLEGGDADNNVAWRYVATDASGQELLVSADGGATWAADPDRKFAFAAFSRVDAVVDPDEQAATIAGGEQVPISDDSAAEFSLGELNRAVVDGDTVVIDFGDFVFTLVVDQSGSMTWNDREGLRFDFLRDLIDDVEAALPPPSEATYSIVKFRSRQIGGLTLTLQAGEDASSLVEGIRVVRKAGTPPTGPTDGLVVFEGLASRFVDTGLTTGTKYFYAAFSFDAAGNFSDAIVDFAEPSTPPAPPVGVAALAAEEEVVPLGGNDVGKRKVNLSWANPAGFDYSTVTLVRRDDREPFSPEDGTILLDDAPASTTSFVDFDPSNDPVNGLTYFYAVFTKNAAGVKCAHGNARRRSVRVSVVERTWELAEPPLNVPPAGFDDTPPAAPTSFSAAEGSGELLLSWAAGDAENHRYRVFHRPDRFPLAQNPVDGAADYDGDLVFDGTATSFAHRGLDNGQPNFYVLVSMDKSNNQSSAVTLRAAPDADATDAVPPPIPDFFSAEVANASAVRLEMRIPSSDVRSVTAFFGDAVRAISTVSFLDTDPATTSAEFVFLEDEDSRSVANLDEDAPVDPNIAIEFSNAPLTNVGSITGVVRSTPLLALQNKMQSASVRFHAALRVVDRSTGALIQQVVTDDASVELRNPFELSIANVPEQTVARRTWNPACTGEQSAQYDVETVPGVYVRSGDAFSASVEVTFRGNPLGDDDNIALSVRVLDADTNAPSPSVRIPGMSADGVLNVVTRNETDEVLDRSGEPTGETVTKTVVPIEIPPQDVPGDYVLEVTGTHLGYVRTATLDVHFEPILNIDVDARAFNPNGADIREQKALVYLAPFDSPGEDKTPVEDLTVTNWSIRPLAGQTGGKSRPFFSRDGVPGVGVKAFTRGGVARNVFFGPGADVEPARPVGGEFPCTDGELWEVSVRAEALGMSAEGFAAVELLPFVPTTLDRILLRNAAPGKFQSDKIFADGVVESTWEVVARPGEDGVASDLTSGVFFRDSVTGLGGTVPVLEEGRVVTLTVKEFHTGDSVFDFANLIIVTNLTGEDGVARGFARARVQGGKATFRIRLNARVAGEARQPPLSTEISNRVYPGELVLFEEASLIFSLSASVIVEVNGRPVAFGGGGGSFADVPPAFLSFSEPLQP